ncbi:hypothetical protein PEDI_50620 [Persicobacter diffluens]|uniref:BIG2 domain-containing protein n=2 Tax=Persicobacter diffluens TaxID=981 RepID=A0AAN5ALZ2_9BACT|nr:hypothetical protein PEDI_50620 [Persicobacter diffluens]
MRNCRFTVFAILFFLIGTFSKSMAQKVKYITPVTQNILMVHLSEGEVLYERETKNDFALNKTALNIELADDATSYTINSADDGNFNNLQPIEVGRKSKADHFTYKGMQWAGGAFDPRTEPWITEHWVYLKFDQAFEEGKTYTLNLSALGTIDAPEQTFTFNTHQLRSESVHVNTLGYRPDEQKFAYIYHWAGTLGGIDLTYYDGKKFEVVNTHDGSVAYEGTLSFRKSKDNHETAQKQDTPNQNFLGADVYDADFSGLSAPGEYVVSVEGMGCSFPFKIGDDPILAAYRTTMRALYHQRSGIRIEEAYDINGDGIKTPYVRPVTQNPMVQGEGGISFKDKILYSKVPFAKWTSQDGGDARDEVIAKAKGNVLNVAGWYHDAGDWDGYYSHQRIPMLLMATYEYLPQMFGDDEMDLPESGNGIPDIVDEASWLIKFNYRLRKETMAKGYSDGGVGGARVAPDPFTHREGAGNPEDEGKPSWQDERFYAVTEADAFMTYMYAGEAAQLAMILKKLGRDPQKFPIEMLDNVDFDQMSRDEVDLIKEAEESWDWAHAAKNQPEGKNKELSDLYTYRTYAAVNLYRLTGKAKYHAEAIEGLNRMKGATILAEDQRWAVYSYLLADNYNVDEQLKTALEGTMRSTANNLGAVSAERRACRWGGLFDFPMLVGQGTTPWVFENIVAYGYTGDKSYLDVVDNTTSYFLGTNPNHTTWMTGVGPRPMTKAFNLDGRIITDNWGVYPGWIPYGPWTYMDKDRAGVDGQKWTMPDGIERQGGQGPWSSHWFNFSLTPIVDHWPGHERKVNNVFTPLSSENTLHQNTVYAAIAYGVANGRQFSNATAAQKVGNITLTNTDHTFEYFNETAVIGVEIDNKKATIAALKWESSNPEVMAVDQFGRLAAVGNGTATITCKTLDGSVSTTFDVENTNLKERPVSSIRIDFDEDQLEVLEGARRKFYVEILPEDATDKTWHWESEDETIVGVDGEFIVALKAGTTTVHAVSNNNDEATAALSVKVNAAAYTVVADFDEYIPVFNEGPQNEAVEIFTTNAAVDIEAENPLKEGLNTSDKVLKVTKADGEWKLFGFSSPNYEPFSMCEHNELTFLYYGEHLTDVLYSMETFSGNKIEERITVEPATTWTRVSLPVPANGLMKSFVIFTNPEDAAGGYDMYFDDFKFRQDPNAVCEEENDTRVVLDFENIKLDWVSGYGSFGWNDPQDTLDNGKPNFNYNIIDNDSSEANPSKKVFEFNRTGNNAGAGFGIQVKNAYDLGRAAKVTMKVKTTEYMERCLLKIVEYGKVDGEEEEKELRSLEGTIDTPNVRPNEWITIEFPIADMTFAGDDSKSLTKVKQFIIMPDVGNTSRMDILVDDIAFAGVKAESISIEGEKNIELTLGDSTALFARVLPVVVEDPTAVWTSSDEEVAVIDENGMLKAIGLGTAQIIATANMDKQLTDTLTITVVEPEPEVPTDVDGKYSVSIYPNPTNGSLTIKTQKAFTGLRVNSISGQLVLNQTMNGHVQKQIDLSAMPSGIYLLTIIHSDGSSQVHRFVKQ